jgi:hypothetical protein
MPRAVVAPLPIAHLTRRPQDLSLGHCVEGRLFVGVACFMHTCSLACGAAHFFFWRVGMSYLATRKTPLALLVTTRLLSQPTQIA